MPTNIRYRDKPLKAVVVSNDILSRMLKEGHVETGFTTIEGVPADAELMYVWQDYDFGGKQLHFIFTHPSFDPVRLYGEIPTISSVHRRNQ